MRRYLLAWYGITDLGASLGLHGKEGPIWGALKAGGFDDVRILAYTNPDKQRELFGSEQADAFAWLEENQEEIPNLSDEEIWEFIDLFSNTGKAHRIYKNWLKDKASSLDSEVCVSVSERRLSRLNDAAGIYRAASDCIKDVLSEEEEKHITVHISPGTPLMAFTWGLLAIRNPELNIKVISSSDHRREYEEIDLPSDLMKSEIRSVSDEDHLPESFDVVFHLFGEQPVPGLLGILQFESRMHVFVTSQRYPADCMRQFLPVGARFDQMTVDPFDPQDVYRKTLEKLGDSEHGIKVGFNLTGGTKLMYSGALEACRKVGAFPFYFETARHQMISLETFGSFPAADVPDVEMYLKIKNFKVVRSGRWADDAGRERRKGLTSFLWKNRKALQPIYYEVSPYNDPDKAGCPFDVPKDKRDESVKASLSEDGSAELVLAGKKFKFPDFPDFARYLSGGWLEEFCYLCLSSDLSAGKLKDMRIGLEVTWDFGRAEDEEDRAQEFDIILTDGKKLTIIECKAGVIIEPSTVDKLQNCVRKYGGVTGKGILVTAFPLKNETARKKLNEADCLTHCFDDDLSSALYRAISS
jgi:hypothetical protein